MAIFGALDVPYSLEMDVKKCLDTDQASSILLKAGDVAISFPEDAHMLCLKISHKTMIYKTVVKIPVR